MNAFSQEKSATSSFWFWIFWHDRLHQLIKLFWRIYLLSLKRRRLDTLTLFPKISETENDILTRTFSMAVNKFEDLWLVERASWFQMWPIRVLFTKSPTNNVSFLSMVGDLNFSQRFSICFNVWNIRKFTLPSLQQSYLQMLTWILLFYL